LYPPDERNDRIVLGSGARGKRAFCRDRCKIERRSIWARPSRSGTLAKLAHIEKTASQAKRARRLKSLGREGDERLSWRVQNRTPSILSSPALSTRNNRTWFRHAHLNKTKKQEKHTESVQCSDQELGHVTTRREEQPVTQTGE
jgi:hypothetical protein